MQDQDRRDRNWREEQNQDRDKQEKQRMWGEEELKRRRTTNTNIYQALSKLKVQAKIFIGKSNNKMETKQKKIRKVDYQILS